MKETYCLASEMIKWSKNGACRVPVLIIKGAVVREALSPSRPCSCGHLSFCPLRRQGHDPKNAEAIAPCAHVSLLTQFTQRALSPASMSHSWEVTKPGPEEKGSSKQCSIRPAEGEGAEIRFSGIPLAPGVDHTPPWEPLPILSVMTPPHPQLKAYLLAEAENRFWQMLHLKLHHHQRPTRGL